MGYTAHIKFLECIRALYHYEKFQSYKKKKKKVLA